MADIAYKPPFVPVNRDIQPIKPSIDVEKLCIKYGEVRHDSLFQIPTTGGGTKDMYIVPNGKVFFLYSANVSGGTTIIGAERFQIWVVVGNRSRAIVGAYFTDAYTSPSCSVDYKIPIIMKENDKVFVFTTNTGYQLFQIMGYEVPSDLFYREY